MLSKKDVIEINREFHSGKIVNEGSLDYAIETTKRSKNWLRSAAYLVRAVLIDHAFEDGNRKKRAQGKPETNLGEIKRSLEQRFSQIAAEYDAFLSDKEIEKKLTLLKNALDGKKVTDGTQLKIPPLEKPSSTVSGTSPTPSNTSPTAPETPVTPTTDNDEKDRQAQIQRILDLQKQVRELEQKINQQ